MLCGSQCGGLYVEVKGCRLPAALSSCHRNQWGSPPTLYLFIHPLSLCVYCADWFACSHSADLTHLPRPAPPGPAPPRPPRPAPPPDSPVSFQLISHWVHIYGTVSFLQCQIVCKLSLLLLWSRLLDLSVSRPWPSACLLNGTFEPGCMPTCSGGKLVIVGECLNINLLVQWEFHLLAHVSISSSFQSVWTLQFSGDLLPLGWHFVDLPTILHR